MERVENKIYKAISILLKDCPHLMGRIFKSNKYELVASPQQITENMQLLSSGEKVLIKAALDFWNGSGRVALSDVLYRLSPNNIKNLQTAIASLQN